MMDRISMKRLLAGLIVGLLLIVACNSVNPTDQSSPSQSTPTVMTSNDAYRQVVTLQLSDWHLTEPHWEKAIREMMVIFEEENPDISVELIPVTYGEKENKYITEIQAGSGPDLMHLHGFSIRSFIEKGFLYDITSFIEQEPQTEWDGEFIDTWYPQTVELMKYQDSYYALPSDFMAMILFYNKELYRESGLNPDQPPKTWNEFLTYAQRLTRDRNGDGMVDTWGFGTVGAVDPGFELRFTPILLSHGATYLTPDNKCSALNSTAAKEAFQFYIDLVTEYGVVPPGVTAQKPGDVRQQMADERIAMLLGSGWTVPIVSDLNPELNATEALAAAPIPVLTGQNVQKPTTAWISAWMINKNTKYPEEAWRLLKFMTSKRADEYWFTEARVLSARQDISGGLEDQGVMPFEPLINDPFSKVIAGELPRSQFVPQIKEWPQVIEIVNRAAQRGFSGSMMAEQALKEAHDEINTILSTYRFSEETCPEY